MKKLVIVMIILLFLLVPSFSFAATIGIYGTDNKIIYLDSIVIQDGITVYSLLQKTGISHTKMGEDENLYVKSIENIKEKGSDGWCYLVNRRMDITECRNIYNQ